MHRLLTTSFLAVVLVACSSNHVVSGGEPDAGPDAGAPAGLDAGTDGGPEDQLLSPDAGGTGSLTAAGGTLADLRFAVVGDTRPLKANDNADYPIQVIRQIFTDITNLSPSPAFTLSTGDYQYVDPGSGNSSTQVGDYVTARSSYPGLLFPTMGNHECTGYTNSECGSGNTDGITENYTTFMSPSVRADRRSNPYYSIPISAADGSWTAKIVVTAANAWDQDQQIGRRRWRSRRPTPSCRAMSRSRTPPTSRPSAPSTTSSTRAATRSCWWGTPTRSGTRRSSRGGHRRERWRSGDDRSFGFALIARQSDGTLSVQQYDETSGAPTPGGVSFTIDAQGQVGG